MSVIGLPSAAVTIPIAPSIKADKVTSANRTKPDVRPGHRGRTANRLGTVGAHHDIRVERPQERLEVPVSGNYRRDVAERDGENVMQDEGEPFRGRQRMQDHQERGTDRVGEQRFLFWVDTVGAVHG